jgi:predicted Zn-dependent protease
VSVLDIAEAALAAAAGADALAYVTHERSLLLRFAGNRPTQSTAIDDVTVELAVVVDGHVGRAATNSTDSESLAACAARALLVAEAASAATLPCSFPGFRAPDAAQPHHGHDPATAALDPVAGAAALAVAFDTAARHGLEAHGVWTVAEDERAVVTSDGGGALDRTTDALMKLICIAPSGRSGYAGRAAVAESDVSAAPVADRAAAKALAPGPPAELPPGNYPVVLEPRAVGALLHLLGETALDGLAYAEGRGALVGRLGDRVATPAINLADSPRSPATLPRAFDAEGTAKRPVPLIQDGVARGVVHDARSAALAGTESTGHALAPGGESEGPRPTNLVLAGGGAADLDALCAPVERGVYVTRLWYENVVRPRETLVTAVTRDGTFLIEDGKATRPLRDLRLTDSVLGILSRVQDLTAAQELTSEAEYYGRRFAFGQVTPALRAGAARFTDTTG